MIELLYAYLGGAICTGLFCGYKGIDMINTLNMMMFWPILLFYVPYGIGRMYAGKRFMDD